MVCSDFGEAHHYSETDLTSSTGVTGCTHVGMSHNLEAAQQFNCRGDVCKHSWKQGKMLQTKSRRQGMINSWFGNASLQRGFYTNKTMKDPLLQRLSYEEAIREGTMEMCHNHSKG